MRGNTILANDTLQVMTSSECCGHEFLQRILDMHQKIRFGENFILLLELN